ncbi:peptide deformylase [Pseudarthrobacter sp. J1738]|uniref:peptide deformylase n=1 Tax=Pseudarthrobacter sp. J1738 TaxID=3420446 RepID=UPI003D2CDF82
MSFLDSSPHPAAPVSAFTPEQVRSLVLPILEAEALPPIVQVGHPALRQQSLPFDGQLTSEELGALIDIMRQVMHNAPGVGLAAPQIGVPLRLAVLEDKFDVGPEAVAARSRHPLDFFAVVNPQYTATSGDYAEHYEGCLSVRGLQAVVKRAVDVQLDYFDVQGRQQKASFNGWQARIVQHETDHLNGTLYIDRCSIRSLCADSQYGQWAELGFDTARASLGF